MACHFQEFLNLFHYFQYFLCESLEKKEDID